MPDALVRLSEVVAGSAFALMVPSVLLWAFTVRSQWLWLSPLILSVAGVIRAVAYIGWGV